MATSFNIDVAQRTQGHPPTGIERVQQALGRTATELLLYHPEQIGFDRFELKMGLVPDAVAAFRPFGAASLERLGKQASPLG